MTNFSNFPKAGRLASLLIVGVLLFWVSPSFATRPRSCEILFKPKPVAGQVVPLSSNETDAIVKRFSTLRQRGEQHVADKRDKLFSRDDIGRKSLYALDIAALGLLDLRDRISSNRLQYDVTATLLDASELTLRQQAISEIQTKLASNLSAIFDSEASQRWRAIYFENSSHPSPVFPPARVWLTDPKTLQPHQRVEMQAKLDQRAVFFYEVPLLAAALKDASSLRLRQLGWILSAASDADHPFGLTTWIEEFKRAKTFKAQTNLMLETFKRTDLQQLHLLEQAYAELAMYFDIARHATENNWHTYPEFIDPKNSPHGPVLKISEAHSPRYFRENSVTSISNSIDAGGTMPRNFIVTGPNGQGKSTYTRMLAQLVVLAQTGSPVPAARMQLTPLSIVVHVRPPDNPSQHESLFMAEAKTLWNDVLLRARANPYSLVLLDELMPGTTAEIREDTETEFLKLIAATGAISVTNTHNWGTTRLAAGSPADFRNLHVAKYKIGAGPMQNVEAMYDEAAARLAEMGWSRDVVAAIRQRGQARR